MGKSVIQITCDESKRRDASRKRGGWHGTPTDVGYATERGAKGQAPKQDGVVVAKHGNYNYSWYLNKNRVPIEAQILSIVKDGSWHPVKEKQRRRK